MHRSRSPLFDAFLPAATLCLALAPCACGATSLGAKAAAADHDRPVAADEARAELWLELELHPSSDCEERFDLALYADRGVHTIEWEEARNACRERRVRLVYLSRRLKKERLLKLVSELARSVRVAERQPPPVKAPAAKAPALKAAEEANE